MGIGQRYTTVQDAAEYLGMSEGALRGRIQRGQIPFIRDSGRIRFDKQELDKLMHARVRRPGIRKPDDEE